MNIRVSSFASYSSPSLHPFIALLGLIVVLGPSAAAQTSEPSKPPILRIETGMHTARIKQMDVDVTNRYLVTSSDDKTARVWELATGRLLRVLRPPIGDGDEGKLYSIAISPDGQTVVTGGWTGYEWDRTNSIYVFDRESGRLLRRIDGLPNSIFYLVYSHDGRYLAATLGQGNGVRVYDTTTYALVGQDTTYGDDSYGADFDSANRLVTTCLDGFVRLYEISEGASLRLLAKKKFDGIHPFHVRFSPDSSKLAIGFHDSPKVNVVSGKDLSKIFSPQTEGVNGGLAHVSWSADGTTLYASGTYKSNNTYMIRLWGDAGRGAFRDIPASAKAIHHTIALRDGRVVYGTGEPSIGILDANARMLLSITPSVAGSSREWDGLLLSFDGTTVQFKYEQTNDSSAQFSTTSQTLGEASLGGANVQPRKGIPSSFQFTYNKKTEVFSFNGKPLPLEYEQHEQVLGFAIAPDQQHFLLGTLWYIRLFDKKGVEKWKVTVPAFPRGVNISGNGEFAVAAYDDGTIRWYRMSDGQELLAFFPHRDRKRWVLWTPSGYYNASQGADELIGWHLNNGKDSAADFFPLKQTRSYFYRPDVIAKILKIGDEAQALKLANEEAGRQNQAVDVAQVLPPVIEILSPSDGVEVTRGEVTVRYRTRTPTGEPVTSVQALVDGRPVTTRGKSTVAMGQGKDVMEMKIPVAVTASQISIIAENKYSASVPATVVIRHGTLKP